ncbi:MAG: class I SAM-dependent methyltransferase [Nanoarchaeota archaeon]|nr:class I SAM-dependent methyltransferase [Nanoarchaeota archaeon]
MNQEKVWDEIAQFWNERKTRRNKLIDEFLIGKKTVLDLGCGSGRNFIKTRAKIYGVDFSSQMLKYAKEKAEKLKLNFELIHAPSHNLPFKDNFFDSVICIALLHCIKSSRKRKNTLKEIHRVLKSNELCLIIVWNKTSRRLKNKSKYHKISWTIDSGKVYRDNYLYDNVELENELKDVGFKIIEKFENRNNIIIIVKKSE